MDRKQHERCGNCAERDEHGCCETIIETLRLGYRFEGVGAIHVPLDGYCTMYHDSDEYLNEERDAQKQLDYLTRQNGGREPRMWP